MSQYLYTAVEIIKITFLLTVLFFIAIGVGLLREAIKTYKKE